MAVCDPVCGTRCIPSIKLLLLELVCCYFSWNHELRDARSDVKYSISLNFFKMCSRFQNRCVRHVLGRGLIDVKGNANMDN
jgi:hypothetical protein